MGVKTRNHIIYGAGGLGGGYYLITPSLQLAATKLHASDRRWWLPAPRDAGPRRLVIQHFLRRGRPRDEAAGALIDWSGRSTNGPLCSTTGRRCRSGVRRRPDCQIVSRAKGGTKIDETRERSHHSSGHRARFITVKANA